MSKEQSVIVWSKEGCHYCAEIKGFLDENQIAYQTVDVTNQDDRRDILEAKYGVRHVPVVEIGENHVYKGITKVGLQYVQEELAAVKK